MLLCPENDTAEFFFLRPRLSDTKVSTMSVLDQRNVFEHSKYIQKLPSESHIILILGAQFGILYMY